LTSAAAFAAVNPPRFLKKTLDRWIKLGIIISRMILIIKVISLITESTAHAALKEIKLTNIVFLKGDLTS